MSKYTIVIDANFFLHKTYSIGEKIKTGKPFNFIDEPEADKNLLLWKLSVDFAAEIRRFETITNDIVYCIDSSSWRKSVLDAQYKANREKSTSIDWGKIYETHNEFAKSLESLGVTVSRVKGAEADDLIFAWTSYLNQKGINSLIISGDNDLLQLVHLDKSSNANTLYYNKFKKDLFVFPGFETWINEKEDEVGSTNDIFNLPKTMGKDLKSDLKSIIKSNKMKANEINVNDFIFKKILIGDSGDNVPPIHVKVKKTTAGPRVFRVTENMANRVLKKFVSDKMFVKQIHFFDDEYITEICNYAKDIINIDDKDIDQIIESWKLNRDLVYLHKNCIPKNIISLMFQNIESLRPGKKSLMSDILIKDKILEGTSWTPEKKSDFTESGLFDVVKKTETETKISQSDSDKSGFNQGFWEDLLN